MNSTNNLIVIVVIYRLGRGTSGTILFAKTALAKRELSKQMQERTMKKSYLALVGKNKNKHLKNEIIRISLTFSLDIFLLILSLDGIVKEEKFSVTQPIGPIPYKAITTTGIYYLSISNLSISSILISIYYARHLVHQFYSLSSSSRYSLFPHPLSSYLLTYFLAFLQLT